MRIVNLDYHPADSRMRITESNVIQSLTSRMGTGGNNVPLILVIDEEGNGDGHIQLLPNGECGNNSSEGGWVGTDITLRGDL